MFCGKPTRRFSHRVFRVFALSLLLVSAVFTTSFLYSQKRQMETDLLERGRTLAGLLASGARTAVYSENGALVEDTLHGVLEHSEVLSAAVFTAERTLLTAAGKPRALQGQPGSLTPRELEILGSPELRAGCASLRQTEQVEIFCPVLIRTHTANDRELYYENPAVSGREEVAGFVKLTIDRGPLKRDLTALFLRSLLLALALLLAGTGAVFLLSRRVTEPLEQLTEAVRAFGSGGSVREMPPAGDDEIGRLAEAFTGMVQDLAEREREKERLAERLRHAQKMEAVGSLSQGISHDFKNILSTLKAAVHILQKGSPDNEFVLKYTGKIQTSLDRARDLVERLVTFSRTRQIELRPVDLVALLARIAPMLREAIGESGHLDAAAPEDPVRVLGDAASLEQLLLNLAYNARDAMPGGGTLSVRLETVPAASAGESGVARVTVRDTGVGMEPEVRRRLFEPFFTTKDVGSGMGLGLSIVHGIVEQHRGRIRVESAPGEGAVFLVELPLWVEADSRPAPAPCETTGVSA